MSQTLKETWLLFPCRDTRSRTRSTFADTLDRLYAYSRRNHKSLYLVPVESTAQPLEIPLAKGGQAFWLDSRTIAHVVPNEESKSQDLYAISVRFDTEAAVTAPKHISSFPTPSSNHFQYVPSSGRLVFSDEVYDDGNLTSVKDGDKAWENRGTTAFVYDDTYVRHWDTWRGPKHSSLFSVELSKNANGDWVLGKEFVNVLQNTKHVSCLSIWNHHLTVCVESTG